MTVFNYQRVQVFVPRLLIPFPGLKPDFAKFAALKSQFCEAQSPFYLVTEN
jgi:hypothetical protein